MAIEIDMPFLESRLYDILNVYGVMPKISLNPSIQPVLEVSDTAAPIEIASYPFTATATGYLTLLTIPVTVRRKIFAYYLIRTSGNFTFTRIAVTDRAVANTLPLVEFAQTAEYIAGLIRPLVLDRGFLLRLNVNAVTEAGTGSFVILYQDELYYKS